MSDPDRAQPQLRRLVIFTADLAGFTRFVARTEAEELARILDGWYHVVQTAIEGQGGRVVKFMGDGVLAVFPESEAVAAVECALELRGRTDAPGGLRLGVSLHLAVVAEAALGPARSYDVVGMGVNHAFLLGRGPGLRISEPVYRKLPSERRSSWQKQHPPAIYTHEG